MSDWGELRELIRTEHVLTVNADVHVLLAPHPDLYARLPAGDVFVTPTEVPLPQGA